MRGVERKTLLVASGVDWANTELLEVEYCPKGHCNALQSAAYAVLVITRTSGDPKGRLGSSSRSPRAAPPKKKDSQVVWLEPAPPSLLHLRLAQSSGLVVLELDTDENFVGLVHVSMCSLVQQFHKLFSRDNSTVLREMVAFLRANLRYRLLLRHNATTRSIHNELIAPTLSKQSRTLDNVARWYATLMDLGLLAEQVRDRKLQRLIRTHAVELNFSIGALQIANQSWLFEAIDRDRVAREVADGARSEREGTISRGLARAGAAAILPGLWLAYWGTDASNDVAKEQRGWLVPVTAFLLVAVGNLLGRLWWKIRMRRPKG